MITKQRIQSSEMSDLSTHTAPYSRGFRGLSLEGLAIRGLALMTILNVNNIVYQVTGALQVGSTAILILAALVLASSWRYGRSTPLFLFSAMVASYLLLGWLYSDQSTDGSEKSYPMAYLATVIVVWSFTSYLLKVSATTEHAKFLKFLQLMLLIATASVWLTPVLLPLWNYLPLGEGEQRYAGFFGNPNEAGFVAAYALAFVLLLPGRSSMLRVALAAFCFFGVVLSFSKTAIVIAVFVLVIGSMTHLRSRLALILAPLLIGFILVLVSSPAKMFYWVADQQFVELAPAQQKRLVEIGNLMEGQFDDATTTNRTQLWDIGFEQLSKHTPDGAGLGSYHHMEDGVWSVHADNWLGIHNTFLMVLGESGVVPAIFFISMLLVVAWRWRMGHGRGLELAIFFVMLADLMSNHSALEIRYSNVMLGVLFGLSGRSSRRDDTTVSGNPDAHSRPT